MNERGRNARNCAIRRFTFDGLFAPEEAVFIGFGESSRQHLIAAFFPNFLRQLFIVIREFENGFGDFKEVLRKLAHSPTWWAFAS